MPNYTENYNLEKPLPNENYNVEVFNNNADIIDQKLKEVEDSVENIEVPVTSVNGKTGDVEINASDVGAETPEGAQAKADEAEESAKAYADTTKANKSHTHSKSQITDFPTSLPANGGNASTANKLSNARTISLTGDVTGSVSFDGSKNVSINTSVANNSHTHTKANITDFPSSMPANGGNADTVDGIHFRVYNGSLQYYSGGWKDMSGLMPLRLYKGFLDFRDVANNVWHTVVNVSGQGRLLQFSGYSSTNYNLEVRVTIDGNVTEFTGTEFLYFVRGGGENGTSSSLLAQADFKSSLKIEVKSIYGYDSTYSPKVTYVYGLV